MCVCVPRKYLLNLVIWLHISVASPHMVLFTCVSSFPMFLSGESDYPTSVAEQPSSNLWYAHFDRGRELGLFPKVCTAILRDVAKLYNESYSLRLCLPR